MVGDMSAVDAEAFALDGLVQRVDTGVDGPKDDDPNAYRMGVVDDNSRVTARCTGPQLCRVTLED